MAQESKHLMLDDLKIYSDGLIVALKQDKLVEAKEYVTTMGNLLETISKYLESQISYENESQEQKSLEPTDTARTEAERAVLAAKRAWEKTERLEKLSKETSDEAKRLKKVTENAKKEARKADKAAEKAEKAERKTEEAAKKVSEEAAKARQAARRS